MTKLKLELTLTVGLATELWQLSFYGRSRSESMAHYTSRCHFHKNWYATIGQLAVLPKRSTRSTA